jgi:uncharacterized membrane protein YcaP (DUF421 family)
MGKHQIGELQPSELAITILISNIATLPIEDPSIPLITGLVPILTLASLDILMSWAGIKSRTLRKITCGKPVVIINNGVIDQKQMKELRFTSDDLIEALHAQNIFDINEVQFAVVETTGSVSVYQKYDYRPVTNSDMNIKKTTVSPPALIVDNGKLVKEALDRIQLGQDWLFSILNQERIDIKDIFIMTAASDGKYFLIKKEPKFKK